MPESSNQKILIEIQTTVKSMHRQLFGNGQPGVIAEMKGRLHALERLRWIVYGAVFTALAGIFGPDALKLLAGG